jgi:isopenicillin N synthase-like dioxygenase
MAATEPVSPRVASNQPFLAVPFSRLAETGPEVCAELKRVGFVVVSEVPDLAAAYGRVLDAARKLVALPPDELAAISPPAWQTRGWSRGADSNIVKRDTGEPRFVRIVDTHKGSYYAEVPDIPENLWPAQVPEFRPAFLAVCQLVAEVVRAVLPLTGFTEKTRALGRMLHYQETGSADDGNPYWCFRHRDGWLLTGLCAEAFYAAGERVARPAGSGLVIDGAEVSVADDSLIIQVGAYLEHWSSGRVFASDHWVQKAPPGVERFAAAVFLNYEC